MFGARRRAARVVVLDPADRVLLINGGDPSRRHLGRWWEIPGGGVDPGEDTADAAERELREEAGLAGVEVGPCVWTQSVQYSFGPFHFDQDEWIHIARWDGLSRAATGHEPLEAMAFGEIRWWTLDEVLTTQPRTIPYRMTEFLEAL
ncbi:MAG: NUDIX domain-containing protein, partial [Actinomycetes bacterium]